MVLASFGFFNAVAMRVNFNIAMVAMVNFTSADQVNTSDECPGHIAYDNTTSQVCMINNE